MDWTAVRALTARQHGVATHGQLLGVGMTAGQIKRGRRDGLLEQLHRGVYALAGMPHTPHRDIMAAVLASGPGAAASHATAAWLWGLLPAPPWQPEVSVERPGYARLHGVRIHRVVDLAPRWIRVRDGIPVTDPLRTMLELGATCPRSEVADALERGVMSKLFSVAALEWVRAELAASGRNGCGVLKDILDDRALGAARPDGMLEPRLAQLFARYRVERPVFQYVVNDEHGVFVARVDFAYPDVRAFLEVDGYEVHGTPTAMEEDFDRQNRLVALGWVPIRFGWRVLVRNPKRVAGQITDVLAMRRSG